MPLCQGQVLELSHLCDGVVRVAGLEPLNIPQIECGGFEPRSLYATVGNFLQRMAVLYWNDG